MDITQAFSEFVDNLVLNGETRVSINYFDHHDDTWTWPTLLTKERADRLKNDKSIRKIRFQYRSDDFTVIL